MREMDMEMVWETVMEMGMGRGEWGKAGCASAEVMDLAGDTSMASAILQVAASASVAGAM